MITQVDRVLAYMRDFGSITQLEAFKDLGVMRLGARIYDLRRRGHTILSRQVSSKNRYGQTVFYSQYWLKEQEQKEEMK